MAVYRLVVGAYLVAVLYHPRADYQDFFSEKAEAKATPQVYVRLPELRAQVGKNIIKNKAKHYQKPSLRLIAHGRLFLLCFQQKRRRFYGMD